MAAKACRGSERTLPGMLSRPPPPINLGFCHPGPRKHGTPLEEARLQKAADALFSTLPPGPVDASPRPVRLLRHARAEEAAQAAQDARLSGGASAPAATVGTIGPPFQKRL